MSEDVVMFPMWLLVAAGGVVTLGVVAFALYWFLGRGPDQD